MRCMYIVVSINEYVVGMILFYILLKANHVLYVNVKMYLCVVIHEDENTCCACSLNE